MPCVVQNQKWGGFRKALTLLIVVFGTVSVSLDRFNLHVRTSPLSMFGLYCIQLYVPVPFLLVLCCAFSRLVGVSFTMLPNLVWQMGTNSIQYSVWAPTSNRDSTHSVSTPLKKSHKTITLTDTSTTSCDGWLDLPNAIAVILVSTVDTGFLEGDWWLTEKRNLRLYSN